ncbi:9009_t:CDS:2 [Acaulospora colombiana]|uniref:9009_t:CDS:1 n=1 Tax=Acaulospora colombiana TaxID=27376 RepID=A0ACA9M3J7_9GLOM|nr:9009_t:CDS:2 [Acaulospora colombiana]
MGASQAPDISKKRVRMTHNPTRHPKSTYLDNIKSRIRSVVNTEITIHEWRDLLLAFEEVLGFATKFHKFIGPLDAFSADSKQSFKGMGVDPGL